MTSNDICLMNQKSGPDEAFTESTVLYSSDSSLSFDDSQSDDEGHKCGQLFR